MNLPRIACFHGGGSNSAVFAEQCKRLRHLFANEYDFVFFDAPYEREAGPTVLPYFADYAPFRTWLQPGGDIAQEEEGLSRVLQLMDAHTLKRERELRKLGRDDAPGMWIGAMGFSQGTRMVSGLLLRQQRTGYVDGGQRRQRLMNDTSNVDFQFGVLCMGSSSPMGAGPVPLSKQPS
jgi:predicted esterase